MHELAKKLILVAELADSRWTYGLHMSNLIHSASIDLCEDATQSALIAILLCAAWTDSLAWACYHFRYELWDMSNEQL